MRIYDELNSDIMVRHYSSRMFKSYAIRTRKFQSFTERKDPDAVSLPDVKDFLTFLAVKLKVSASS